MVKRTPSQESQYQTLVDEREAYDKAITDLDKHYEMEKLRLKLTVRAAEQRALRVSGLPKRHIHQALGFAQQGGLDNFFKDVVRHELSTSGVAGGAPVIAVENPLDWAIIPPDIEGGVSTLVSPEGKKFKAVRNMLGITVAPGSWKNDFPEWTQADAKAKADEILPAFSGSLAVDDDEEEQD